MRWPFSCKEIRMHRVNTLRGVISGEKADVPVHGCAGKEEGQASGQY